MDDFSSAAGTLAQPESRKLHTPAELKAAVLAKLTYSVGKIPEVASPRDWFLAVAFATRDIVVDRWFESTAEVYADGRKRVYYLSLEFLIGRLLFDAMTNLGVAEAMAEALKELGVSLTELRRVEPDAALGNGGLGRLAACFMDSMATLRIAAHGYGIRYDNGLFRQIIRGGWQQEDARGLARQRQSVGVRKAGSQLRHRLRRLGRNGPGRRRADAARLASRRNRRGGRLRHADRRLARQAREHAPPVVGAGARSVQARRLQRRRFRRRLVRYGAGRGDLEGALSERRDSRRTGAAPQAGVFLRIGVAARPHPSPHQAASGRAHARRARRSSAERHASGNRRRRADAHPDRPQRPRMGRSVGGHAGDVLLHQPHPAAGGARELASPADGALAAAPHANHLSAQRRPSRQRAPARLHRSGISRHPLADRRALGSTGADGQPRLYRLAQDQRRVGPAHGSDAQDRVP